MVASTGEQRSENVGSRTRNISLSLRPFRYLVRGQPMALMLVEKESTERAKGYNLKIVSRASNLLEDSDRLLLPQRSKQRCLPTCLPES